jgi:hypothetical protein
MSSKGRPIPGRVARRRTRRDRMSQEMVSRRTLALLGTVFCVLVLAGVLAGYLVWDGLQLADVVKAVIATAVFAAAWVVVSAKVLKG